MLAAVGSIRFMGLTREYLHHLTGYRLGTGCYWISVYESAPGDAPVVVCSALAGTYGWKTPELAEVSRYLAAEVIEHWLSRSLPDLPRPLLWIERRASKRGPDRYYLLDFPCYRPRPERPGFVRAVTLGSPTSEPLTAGEVSTLTGERLL
jgi:hypothetical protein